MIAAKNEMPPVGETEGIRNTEIDNPDFTAHAQRQQDLSVAGQWDLWIAAFGPDVLPAVNDSSLPSSGKLLADETAAGKPETLNKTPSAINFYGYRHRISNWTVTPTEAATLAQRQQLQQRCKLDPRHNILLHLRQVRVIDIDVPNDTRAASLSSTVCKALNCEPPMRGRNGTGKVSLFVRVEGNRYMHKAVVNLKPQVDPVFGGEKPSAGAIEFLGQSQQSLVAGIHPDGSSYFWFGLDLSNGIEAFPLVTEVQMQAAFAAMRAEPDAEGPQTLVFGDERPAVPPGAAVQTNDPVGAYLGLKGLVVSDCGDKLHIVCPWQEQHTDGASGSESSTSWLLPRLVDGQLVTRGVFNCKHSHCADRKTQEFLNTVGFGGDRSSSAGFGVSADVDVFSGVPLPEGFGPADVLIPFGGPRGGAKEYTLLSPGEFMAKPPVRWYVRDVLPVNGVAVVYGQSRAGKTFIVLDLLLSLLNVEATQWFDHKIRNRPAVVVYMAMEGAFGVRGRLQAWAMENDKPALPENLRFIDSQPFNLSQAADVDGLIAAVQKFSTGQAIVVIDTQAKASAGADEQTAKDMGVVYAAAERIAHQLNGLCVTVAHAGKDESKGMRGSSAQTGAADLIMLVARDGELRTWTIEKNKDGPEGATGFFELAPVAIGHDEEDGTELSSATVVQRDKPIQGKGKKLTTNSRLGLEAMQAVLMRTGLATTDRESWRAEFYSRYGATDGGNAEAKKKAFQRAIEALAASGQIDSVSENVFSLSFSAALPPLTMG